MAGKSFQAQLDDALGQLPAVGQWMEFDEYKSKLYSTNPDGGKAVFTQILKADLVLKKLDVNTEGKPIVLLMRKS